MVKILKDIVQSELDLRWFLIALITFNSCSQPKPDKPAKQVDNSELQRMFDDDQSDRKSGNVDWVSVTVNDSARRVRVYQLLDSQKVVTSKDFYNAAMVFQHGNDTISSSMAVKLMRKAVELDSTIDKWLLAAAIDRDLMRRGKPQIYGTQFVRMSSDEPWILYDLDSAVISDETRIEYGVRTLKQQRERVLKLNE